MFQTASCTRSRGPRSIIAGRSFQTLAIEVLDGLKPVFKTDGPIIVYPASGTGGWEAALVNTLSPGDRVLMYETGHFATLWHELAQRLGLVPELIPGDWRSGADAEAIAARLARRPRARHQGRLHRPQRDLDRRDQPDRADPRVPSTRPAIRLCSWSTRSRRWRSIDYRHDEWGVDVTVAGSQKGLMLPPGLAFNAVSAKALADAASGAAATLLLGLGRHAWISIASGFFAYTPSTNLLYGLQGGDRHAAGGGAGRGVRTARPLRCRHACGRAGVGPRHPVSRGAGTLGGPDGRMPAVRLRCRPAAGSWSWRVSTCRSARAWAGSRARMFRIGHLGDLNDLSLDGHAFRRRDGAQGVRRALVGLGCAGGAGRAGRASGQRSSPRRPMPDSACICRSHAQAAPHGACARTR